MARGRFQIICDAEKMNLHIRRLAWEIWEKTDERNRPVLIGVQPRGVAFARKIHQCLEKISGLKDIPFGILDPTFHRDDFRRKELRPEATDIPFLLSDRHVILIDDVLYTGRTIRSGLDAIQSFGRPSKVELMVLVDRRYAREFPIQPDYTGLSVDTIEGQKVEVFWEEIHNRQEIRLVKEEHMA